MNPEDTVEVHRLVGEKIRAMNCKMLPNPVTLERVRELGELQHSVVFEFETWITGIGKERIDVREKWPKDWWQAFRERWCPRWWLKRHPVQYTELIIQRDVYERVCPHYRWPERDHGDPDRLCIQFMHGNDLRDMMELG